MGLNTPKDQLLDSSVDGFNKMAREMGKVSTVGVKVIPTSEAYRQNYDRIVWYGGDHVAFEEKG
jgi:hypothetical protein